MSRRRGCLELNSTWLKLPLKHVFTLSLAFIAGYSFYHYRVARQLSPFRHYWDQTSSASSSDDPTVGPGWLNHWRWVPAKEGVVMHGFLDKFIEKRGGNVVGTAGNDEHGDDEMDWARNRTILFIGDSVGRELQNAWCRAIGVDRKSIKLNDEDEVNDKTTTSICEHAFYGVKTVFSFLYGMTNYTKPGASDVISGEWPPGPWGYEDRLPEVKQQLDRLNELSLQKGADPTREDGKKVYEPDLIVLNSGAWEFKYMYRRDLKQGLKAYNIQWEELHELAERLKGAINLIRDLWPDAELVWVDVQPFDTNDFGARWFWARGLIDSPEIDFASPLNPSQSTNPIFPPLFTRRRVSQFAATYRQVGLDAGVESVDFWKVAEAMEPGKFYNGRDAIHPSEEPCRTIVDMVFEKLYRAVGGDSRGAGG